VIDTGVDYTHEDLWPNIWQNKKEIPDNGIDDDNNGYTDDVIGWDFASNDNRPFDLSVDPTRLLFEGGNPGHGTHCAGTIAAAANNSLGISGIAPFVQLMALRFITEKGEGTTADAIKAIRYAVDNGAQITSNSWGGEDKKESEENVALKEAIKYGEDKGVLFIAAAGNGRKGVGFDNDSDATPVYPASFDLESIITVAAINSKNELAPFSNWGSTGVHIGAPGVAVFSTMIANQYSDLVVDKFGFKASWDGTSMAAPHVAGAAAYYWSVFPQKTWQEVKAAVLGSALPLSSLRNKVSSGGKLNLEKMMQYQP
ncbi:MAG: S8 family peptidase, partial [Pseudobdellovibrionaceae bacterium]